MLPFIVSVILVVFASLLQTTSAILIFGIKPNLVFALLAVLAHVNKNWLARSALILISSLMLKFSPLLAWPDIIFISTAFLVVALVDFMPWRKIVNSIAATFLGTVVIGLSHFNFRVLAIEEAMNIICVLIFFGAMMLIYGKKEISKKNRF